MSIPIVAATPEGLAALRGKLLSAGADPDLDAAAGAVLGRFRSGAFPDMEAARVPRRSLVEAALAVDPLVRRALAEAARRLHRFHRRERPRAFAHHRPDGTTVGQEVRPLPAAAVALAAAAGNASRLLSLAAPARAASVPRIAVVAPGAALADPVLCAAMGVLGVTEAWALTGAEAVAALALGALGAGPVPIVVGPGDPELRAARRALVREGWLRDVPSGSETLAVMVDSAEGEGLVEDVRSQLEAGGHVVLVTEAAGIAADLAARLAVELLPHPDVLLAVVDAASRASAAAAVASLAPSCVHRRAGGDRGAGSRLGVPCVLAGASTSPALLRLRAGAGSVLPPAGHAAAVSPLSAADFMTRHNVVRFGDARGARETASLELLAVAQGLPAHAAAARARRRRR